MSHQTVRLAECATEIREACDRLLTIAPVASPEDVQAFCEVVRLNAALMAGLGKSLSGAVSVRNTGLEGIRGPEGYHGPVGEHVPEELRLSIMKSVEALRP